MLPSCQVRVSQGAGGRLDAWFITICMEGSLRVQQHLIRALELAELRAQLVRHPHWMKLSLDAQQQPKRAVVRFGAARLAVPRESADQVLPYHQARRDSSIVQAEATKRQGHVPELEGGDPSPAPASAEARRFMRPVEVGRPG